MSDDQELQKREDEERDSAFYLDRYMRDGDPADLKQGLWAVLSLNWDREAGNDGK
jgi:hypothetical protein